jgi:hypothetical protein
MSDHEFPLLIASIDSDSNLSITEQAQSFFASSAVKASSPATLISCISSTSTLFPNLFNNLLSSCLIRVPPSPGIWLRHLHQQDEQSAAATSAHRPASLPKKGAVATPPRDDNSGPVILLLDVVSHGLSEVRRCVLFHIHINFAQSLQIKRMKPLNPFRLHPFDAQHFRHKPLACSRWHIRYRRTCLSAAKHANSLVISASPSP